MHYNFDTGEDGEVIIHGESIDKTKKQYGDISMKDYIANSQNIMSIEGLKGRYSSTAKTDLDFKKDKIIRNIASAKQGRKRPGSGLSLLNLSELKPGGYHYMKKLKKGPLYDSRGTSLHNPSAGNKPNRKLRPKISPSKFLTDSHRNP